MNRRVPRLMIAGTGSGCGKTTLTCGILGALLGRGTSLAAFKCGPDYIDPMFHQQILGISSRNLDLFLCGKTGVKQLLLRNTPAGATALLEGVMGFYDGLGQSGSFSSWELSQVLEIPTVLAVNARGKALSLAAEISGFLGLRPNRICGIILNCVPEKLYPKYREMIESECGVEVLGYLPPLPQAALESRHLGLVTASEVQGLQEKMALLAGTVEQTVRLDRLLELAQEASPLYNEPMVVHGLKEPVSIAVASDKAFCFHYQDNLALLEEMGAQLRLFSPLTDEKLPEEAQGLLLWGGYPELYAHQLAENRSLLGEIRRRVLEGLPTIAECGGYMLLCQALELEGQMYPMAGVLPGNVSMTRRLGRFGYLYLTAQRDNLLCKQGTRLPAHEFHYSQADNPGKDMRAYKPGQDGEWECIHAGPTLWAGYPHLHFWSAPEAALRFLQKCAGES